MKILNQAIKFIQEAREELLKVNWPNKKQIVNYTLAIIAISLVVAIFIGGLDYFFSQILRRFII